jgi:hypothetical protein
MSTLLSLCLPSLVLGVVADAVLKRRSPDGSGLLDALCGIVGFVLLPLTGLAMVALPALDAHTRLLLGRSLALRGDRETARIAPHLARRSRRAPRRQAHVLRPRRGLRGFCEDLF